MELGELGGPLLSILVALESARLADHLCTAAVVGREELEVSSHQQRAVLVQGLLHSGVADIPSLAVGHSAEVAGIASYRVGLAAGAADEVEVVGGVDVLLVVLLKQVSLTNAQT